MPVDRCAFCGARIARGVACAGCFRDLPWNTAACGRCALPLTTAGTCPACLERPPAADSAWTAFRYAPPIDRMILDFKYRGGLRQGRLLGLLAAERLATRAQALPTRVVPVPLHWRRLLRRGYNQSLELARVLGSVLPLTIDRDVKRRRATADQIGKTAAARRRNVRGAFATAGVLAGRHVAILDDVMTTGATVNELARVCREAGAARIEAWAIARVE